MNTNESTPHYPGERLSLKGQTCTVRYVGAVSGKAGDWLGVEWDDPNRGKHDGTFEGKKYFECHSTSSTAASFLKSTQIWDQPRSFLSALREKYMDDFHQDEGEVVYISGKQAEEIGFEKFAQRQSRLHGIHVLVLDHMRIKLSSATPADDEDAQTVRKICADITELDVSGNLFEGFLEVLDLCALMPKLRVLTLDANRFEAKSVLAGVTDNQYGPLTTIRSLNLSRTLLRPNEVEYILPFFPGLQTLAFAGNEINQSLHFRLPPGISVLDLSDNHISALSDLRDLSSSCPNTIILKRNAIRTVGSQDEQQFRLPVIELDLTYNKIDSWTFFDDITTSNFPKLRHLRVTGNPVYRNLTSAEGKPLAAEDGYMLTIARLPQIEYLNYAKITDKERLNAETYYLNQISIEISRATEEQEAAVTARHPRYRELCDEYDEPSIERRTKKEEIDSNSLAARLVTIVVTLAPHILPEIHSRCWVEEAPKSINVYTLLGMIGKRLGVIPLSLRLVLETNERDPKGRGGGYEGPEWWDSSDDEEVEGLNDENGEWVQREVELMAGTRAIGTYVESREARIRVELRDAYD